MEDLQNVVDNPDDIATNFNVIKIRVNLAREEFQKVFVHAGTVGSITSTRYNEATDAPQHWQPNLVISRRAKIPGEGKIEMLIIGLCFLDEPSRYSSKGTGAKNKQRSTTWANIGIIDRPSRMTYVMVQTTKDVRKTNINYFAAVRPEHGMSHIKRVTQDMVFFFSEVTPEGIEDLPSTKRGAAFNKACKHAAAENPEVHENVELTEDTDVAEDALLDSAGSGDVKPSTTTEEVAGTLEANAVPDRNGKDAFYDKDENFTIDDCNVLLAELQSLHDEFIAYDARHLLTVRECLRTSNRLHDIQDRYFVYFQMMMVNKLRTSDNETAIAYKVDRFLEDLEVLVKVDRGRDARLVTKIEEFQKALLSGI